MKPFFRNSRARLKGHGKFDKFIETDSPPLVEIAPFGQL